VSDEGALLAAIAAAPDDGIGARDYERWFGLRQRYAQLAGHEFAL
jgi:hypothetical protein